MLLFKNGRFHKNGASFTLPDNFLFDPSPGAEIEGLTAWSPDMTISIELGLQEEGSDARTDFEDYFDRGSELDIQVRNSMMPTVVNGLQGYMATYLSNGAAYVEYRFELPEGGLMWLVFGKKGISAQELLESEDLAAMLSVIRRDSQ